MSQDNWPEWTSAEAKRMLKLKDALNSGNFDEVFDQMFPPEENSADDSTSEQR
jgi:hypothetical protein